MDPMLVGSLVAVAALVALVAAGRKFRGDGRNAARDAGGWTSSAGDTASCDAGGCDGGDGGD